MKLLPEALPMRSDSCPLVATSSPRREARRRLGGVLFLWGASLVCAFLTPSPASAQAAPAAGHAAAVQRVTARGVVDWTGGVVRASGFGVVHNEDHAREGRRRVAALRAAMADAQRNLAETVDGVQISSTTTVRDLVVTDDRVTAVVSGFVRGARRVSETYREEGGQTICEVELEAPLGADGGFASLLMPFVAGVVDAPQGEAPRPIVRVDGRGGFPDDPILDPLPPFEPTPAPPLPTPAPTPASTPAPTATPPPPPAAGVTGILFDARATGYGWNLFPVVETESAQRIFDMTALAVDARGGRFVPFVFDPVAGAEHERTRATPLVVEAVTMRSGTLVISDEDGRRLLALEGEARVLSGGRLLFVIAPPPGD